MDYGGGTEEMEKECKCKVLEAIYTDDKKVLSGLHKISFIIKKHTVITVSIEQNLNRSILIVAEQEVPVFDLQAILTRIERLLMLFDGYFLTLSKFVLSDSNSCNKEILDSIVECFLKNRLSYFTSAFFCRYSINQLVKFDLVITDKLYLRWEKLLEELDMVNQMYLYNLCDNGMTVDIKCAFLIELAEPLVEILKKHKKCFSSLSPREKTTLKKCLDVLIKEYGADIYKSELSLDYYKFLSIMVYSRVRIMHIKRDKECRYFNGSESVLYAIKMSLIYRCIIFVLLDINSEIYHASLIKCVTKWDKWQDVLERLKLELTKA